MMQRGARALFAPRVQLAQRARLCTCGPLRSPPPPPARLPPSPPPPQLRDRFPYNLLSRIGSRRLPLLSKDRFPLSFLRRASYQHGRVPFYRKPLFYIPVSFITGYIVYHIDTVELTGRKRLLLLPGKVFARLMELVDESMLRNVSSVLLPETSSEHKLIQSVVNQLCTANNLPDLSKRTYVIEDPELNACCTGGGMILVNTGLVHALRGDRNKLALVLGHEMGHFIAQHAAELAGETLLVFLFKWCMGALGGFAENMYALGVKLPSSRRCEQEADFIGLNLAARACFNLKDAQKVWYAMILAEMGGDEKTVKPEDVAVFVERGEGILAFLGTHPTWKWRLKAYDPEGEWMLNALQLQRETCMPYNYGAPPRVNPLAWWLDKTRAFLPQIMKGEESGGGSQ